MSPGPIPRLFLWNRDQRLLGELADFGADQGVEVLVTPFRSPHFDFPDQIAKTNF